MRANGCFGYLDGTVIQPPLQITNASGNRVLNLEYALWRLIDSQLLFCLTVTLSVATFPHILGLEHAIQVCQSLESRFNSFPKLMFMS